MKRMIFTMLLFAFFTKLFATSDRKQLQLRIEAQYGSYNQTTVYFGLGLNPSYNAVSDAREVITSIPGFPNIYSLTSDSVKCQIYGCSPLTQSAVIGIGLLLDSTALYTFTLPQFSNFDSSSIVILEDRQLHTFTELQVNFYQVLLTPQDTTGRFFLHVTRAAQFSPDTAGCSNNNGSITVLSDSSISWTAVSIADSSGTNIITYNSASSRFAFNNLAEGYYTLAFIYNGYAFSKQVYVIGTYIVASINVSNPDIAVGDSVTFSSDATNTNNYTWYLGDSSIITGVANPGYTYYIPGVFTVTMICSNNYGCSAQAQTTITVGEPASIGRESTPKNISIVNLGRKTVEVVMNGLPINSAELQVYNMLGQAVYTSPVTAEQMRVSLANEPAGVYLVTVKNVTSSKTLKIYIN